MAWIWTGTEYDPDSDERVPLPKYDFEKNNESFDHVFRHPYFIDEGSEPAWYNLKSSKMARLKKYQVLEYQDLVKGEVLDLFRSLPKSEVQLYPTKIQCKDGVVDDFFAVRPLISHECTDLNRSKVTWLSKNESFFEWRRLEFLPNCMKDYAIVFEKYSSKYVISDEFYKKLIEIDPQLEMSFVRPRDLVDMSGRTSAEHERHFWVVGVRYDKFWRSAYWKWAYGKSKK